MRKFRNSLNTGLLLTALKDVLVLWFKPNSQAGKSLNSTTLWMLGKFTVGKHLLVIDYYSQLQLVKVVEALTNSNYKVKGACLDAVYEWVNHKWTTVHYQDVLLLTLCLAPLGFLYL
ncbi:hypothetical protein OUZ56_011868 [Daphnia magna]|uniref:Uncharacterized protein n=1 Tax=Daphnia magna TaxID=35525 RepID=A0ABQ9Z1B8_9CRUS|nr:hypothetical protein OUZ56_011868 [Daphnia magna]